MFNDFDGSAVEEEGKGRRAASLGVAALIFLLVGSGVAAAMATVRAVQREQEERVMFEDLPLPPPPEVEEAPPPPPPPPVRRVRNNEPRGERPVLDGPPDGIPEERPEEADGELTDAGNTGPIDNDAEMGEGGDGPAIPEGPETRDVAEVAPRPVAPPPEQERQTIHRARFLASESRCSRISISSAIAEALGAQTVRIRVRALVGTDGNVQSARVVSGHEAIPEDLVIRCAEQWVFAPATLPNGTAVPYPAIRTFVIRPRT